MGHTFGHGFEAECEAGELAAPGRAAFEEGGAARHRNETSGRCPAPPADDARCFRYRKLYYRFRALQHGICCDAQSKCADKAAEIAFVAAAVFHFRNLIFVSAHCV
jgi:hypothetical protein